MNILSNRDYGYVPENEFVSKATVNDIETLQKMVDKVSATLERANKTKK